MNIEKILQEVKFSISQKFDEFKGIYLYGSRSKGTFQENSDIDLIILFNNQLSYKEERELAKIISKIEYNNDVFIDYHPYTLPELEQNPFFYDEVVCKGIYYEAA